MKRPSFVVYGVLAAFVLGSAFPFYWSFLVASRDNSILTGDFTLIPGGNFLTNAARVFESIPLPRITTSSKSSVDPRMVTFWTWRLRPT